METQVYGFDTEDQNGKTTVFAAACEKCDCAYSFNPATRGEFVGTLEGCDSVVNVFCLNLGYDLINFFGVHLPDFLILYFGRKKLVGAKLRGCKVYFRDIGRYIPKKSIREIGEYFKLPKIEVDIEKVKDGSIPIEYLKEYCLRDAKIAQLAGEKIIQFFDKNEMEL